MLKLIILLSLSSYLAVAEVKPLQILIENPSKSDASLCATLNKIHESGATDVVVGWYEPAVTGDKPKDGHPVEDSALSKWGTELAICKPPKDLNMIMGMKLSSWNTVEGSILTDSVKSAAGMYMTKVLWDIEDISSCDDSSISYIINTLNTVVRSTAEPSTSILLSLPAAYLSNDASDGYCVGDSSGTLIASLSSMEDTQNLDSIVVQYFDHETFTDYESIFERSNSSDANGTSIDELVEYNPQFLNKFRVGKHIHKDDGAATDFVELKVLDHIVVRAQDELSYEGGLFLSSWKDGDEELITAAFSNGTVADMFNTTRGGGVGAVGAVGSSIASATIMMSSLTIATGLWSIIN